MKALPCLWCRQLQLALCLLLAVLWAEPALSADQNPSKPGIVQVQDGDMASVLAFRLKPRGATIEQMMVALLRQPPMRSTPTAMRWPKPFFRLPIGSCTGENGAAGGRKWFAPVRPWSVTSKNRRTGPMAAEKSQNVQDVFLNHVRKSKTPVTIFLVNGVKLQGIITWFDNFSVLLRRDGHTQLVYKHAISTVMPGAPIMLFDATAQAGAQPAAAPASETRMTLTREVAPGGGS